MWLERVDREHLGTYYLDMGRMVPHPMFCRSKIETQHKNLTQTHNSSQIRQENKLLVRRRHQRAYIFYLTAQ